VQKFVETLVVARKRTDENGGKPKMDAVLKKAEGSKGNLRERSATLFEERTVISMASRVPVE
jgi:hypothetical protein